jgi:acyl-CoA thioesterase-2
MLRALVERLGAIAPAAEDDAFLSGPAAGVFDRVYGGQSLSEALMAAARTTPADRRFHAAHCHFLKLGDPTRATRFRVERLGDGRSFAVRHVRAEQEGRLILVATFSFAAPSEGITHQRRAPDAPPPDTALSRDEELIALHGRNLPTNAGVPWPIDIRHLDQRPWDETIGSGHHRLWMRADEALPDDPLLHAALLLYASDLTMADAVTVQHPIRWEDLIAGRDHFGASLDHAFWLHAPARMDEWLLHEQESSRAADGRGFTTGRFFDRSGALVASVAQEIFIRATRADTT